jgi:hypothetical protein
MGPHVGYRRSLETPPDIPPRNNSFTAGEGWVKRFKLARLLGRSRRAIKVWEDRSYPPYSAASGAEPNWCCFIIHARFCLLQALGALRRPGPGRPPRRRPRNVILMVLLSHLRDVLRARDGTLIAQTACSHRLNVVGNALSLFSPSRRRSAGSPDGSFVAFLPPPSPPAPPPPSLPTHSSATPEICAKTRHSPNCCRLVPPPLPIPPPNHPAGPGEPPSAGRTGIRQPNARAASVRPYRFYSLGSA